MCVCSAKPCSLPCSEALLSAEMSTGLKEAHTYPHPVSVTCEEVLDV